MKRIFTFMIISIVSITSIVYIAGCQKFDYDPSMAATINGLGFKAEGKSQVFARVDTFTHNPQLVIITANTTIYTPGTSFTPSIILTVPNVPGSYSINTYDTTKRAMVYTAATGSAGSAAVSGQINILNISGGKIQGNFSLSCADGTQVTNGQYIATESYY